MVNIELAIYFSLGINVVYKELVYFLKNVNRKSLIYLMFGLMHL